MNPTRDNLYPSAPGAPPANNPPPTNPYCAQQQQPSAFQSGGALSSSAPAAGQQQPAAPVVYSSAVDGGNSAPTVFVQGTPTTMQSRQSAVNNAETASEVSTALSTSSTATPFLLPQYHGVLNQQQAMSGVVPQHDMNMQQMHYQHRQPIQPIYKFDGGTLNGVEENDYWDLCDAFAGRGLPDGQPQLSQNVDFSLGFSFSARLHWNRVGKFSRVFDFGHGGGGNNLIAGLNPEEKKVIGMAVCSRNKCDFLVPDFSAKFGGRETNSVHMFPTSSHASEGYDSNWLFTADFLTGTMKIYRDGYLLQTKRLSDGEFPGRFDNERRKCLIGRSWWAEEHQHDNSNFAGKIENMKIFDRAVDWSDAFGAECVPEGVSSVSRVSARTVNGETAEPLCTGVPGVPSDKSQRFRLIFPNLQERLVIPLLDIYQQNWSNDNMRGNLFIPVPAVLAQRGMSDSEWRGLVRGLNRIPAMSCLFPCTWVWIYYILIMLVTLWVGVGFLLCLLPIGYLLDASQWLARCWLCRANKKLANYGCTAKFQIAQRNLPYVSTRYLCIAVTPGESEVLKKEPRFVKGFDLFHQDRDEEVLWPIHWHRVV